MVATVLAGLAADRAVDLYIFVFAEIEQLAFARIGGIGLLALRTQHAHQALGQHADQAGGEQEGLDTDVVQTGHGADGRIGVQGGEHEVTGEGGLHGDLRRLLVSDLTDHHHVGILSQDGAQAAGEGHVDLGVHLGLADAVEVVLDRIFDGHDIAAVIVDARERSVKGGGLTGTGRPGDQDDAVGLVDELVHVAHRGLLHP